MHVLYNCHNMIMKYDDVTFNSNVLYVSNVNTYSIL